MDLVEDTGNLNFVVESLPFRCARRRRQGSRLQPHSGRKAAGCAGEVQADHTTLELQCIDRIYLSVYVPLLQTGSPGVAILPQNLRGNPGRSYPNPPRSQAL